MVTFVSQGDGKFRIEDGTGREIGWIRGSSIGIRGFASANEAMTAASALRRILNEALARFGIPLPPYEWTAGALRLVHDGAYEWIADANFPVARLYRPDERSRDETFALEFVVPAAAGEQATIATARALLAAYEGREAGLMTAPV